MNSEFSFSTGCLTNVDEPNRPDDLTMVGKRTDSHLSQEYLYYEKYIQPPWGFELVSLCPFPTPIIITPQVPPRLLLILKEWHKCRTSVCHYSPTIYIYLTILWIWYGSRCLNNNFDTKYSNHLSRYNSYIYGYK